jgi:hypothetical protein
MSQCHSIYVDSCCHLQSHVTVSLYIFLLILWFCCCRKRPSSTEISLSNLRRHTHHTDWRFSLFILLHTRKFYNITLLLHVLPNSHSILLTLLAVRRLSHCQRPHTQYKNVILTLKSVRTAPRDILS